MSNEQLTDEQIKQKLEAELGPQIHAFAEELLAKHEDLVSEIEEGKVSHTPAVNWYEFDWDNKVNTLEDVKEIFKSLRMTVSDKAEDFETLKKFIKDEVAYQTN